MAKARIGVYALTEYFLVSLFIVLPVAAVFFTFNMSLNEYVWGGHFSLSYEIQNIIRTYLFLK